MMKAFRYFLFIGFISFNLFSIIQTGKYNINTYKETTETINNPGAGYTTSQWCATGPNHFYVKDSHGNLVLFLINLGEFSCGYNGVTEGGKYTEGTDYDLDDYFFQQLRANFENVRKNGGTIAIRFRYDDKGKSNPEPATFEQMAHHIDQIKKSGVLEEYKDIIMFVESGFVGQWGEQHSGKYAGLENKAKTLGLVLDMTPDNIPVTVRVPNTFCKYVNISQADIDKFVSVKGTREARIGMYNDGYMGSDTDLGTFTTRVKETSWMFNQNRYTYYGGEFSGDLNWAKKYDTYLPENSIKEMYKTHLSYINGNIFALFREYEFNERYAIENVDNSAYYGQTIHKFMRDHLGYRLVLRYAEITASTQQGGTFEIRMRIENTGFANPIKEQKAEIILERQGNYMKAQVDVDATEFWSCQTTEVYLVMKIPGAIDMGVWNVYFKLSVGKSNLDDFWMRSIKFANSGIWNGALGANKIGSLTVAKSYTVGMVIDYHFYQTNTEKDYKTNGELLTYMNITVADGVKTSPYEWPETYLYSQVNDSKIYLKTDEHYLYVMAKLKTIASSPVYNINLKNGDSGFNYWYYIQSNGLIYFNQGTPFNVICKASDDIIEFRIPFEIMNLTRSSTIDSIRIAVQDLSQKYLNVGQITGGKIKLNDTIFVYSAFRPIYLKEHEDFTIRALTVRTDVKYQWYFKDQIISGATKSEYTLKDVNADSVGIYSVKIVANNGVETTSKILNLMRVYT